MTTVIGFEFLVCRAQRRQFSAPNAGKANYGPAGGFFRTSATTFAVLFAELPERDGYSSALRPSGI
jgi:hypothetical protein